jgi:hypothetical protein
MRGRSSSGLGLSLENSAAEGDDGGGGQAAATAYSSSRKKRMTAASIEKTMGRERQADESTLQRRPSGL